MKPKESSRKIQAAETKKRIYENAVELIAVRGFNNVSVDDIVEAAGVSKGTFYVHYKSKYSLIADYVSTLDLRYEGFFYSLPPDTKPTATLLLVTGRVIDMLIYDIGYDDIKTAYEALIKKVDAAKALLNYDRKLYQLYRQIIMEGIRQGEFRKTLNADSFADHCIMSIRGMTFEWCIRYPDFDLKKEVFAHFDILLPGIKNV